ncbi:MAG: hypothetical protein ACK53L_25015, partial [Pirellulaceae bacterium]
MLKTLASALVIASLGFVAQAQADCGGCGGGGLLARLHAKHSCGGGLLARLHAGRCGGEAAPSCCEPAPPPAPSCSEPAPSCGSKRVGLLARLRARLHSCSCAAPAPSCCEPAPAPAC